ncbi:MAG: acyl-ACP--UDP-N-acetylglucosamine O-acyltransferase [Lysobacteraceae bacterium]
MISADAGIHPSAVVDPDARIEPGVRIGPFVVIGAGVEIAAGTRIGPHTVIEGPTRIGRDNTIHAHVVLGGEPQDKKYRDQPTRLEIGDGNTIREFVTVNRGTAEDEGITRIGDDNWIMAYVHIAHDCVVGNHTIFANAASLAGHCRVEDYAILGGFSLIHQFCQVGAHAFTAMGSVISRDVPPFVTVAGPYAAPHGINSEGLKRRGYDSARIMAIKRAYRTLYKSGLPLAEARQQLADAADSTPDIRQLLDFIDRSKRSLIR